MKIQGKMPAIFINTLLHHSTSFMIFIGYPRYEKVINTAISNFIEYKLDAIFIATNAPGRSAFNRVERRMAPLSRDLAGLVLPHDHFGSHLDDHGKTVDPELEKENFAHAGQVLAEIWSDKIIDGYPTLAKYVDPADSEVEEGMLLKGSPGWRIRHVRESHYMVQVREMYQNIRYEWFY